MKRELTMTLRLSRFCGAVAAAIALALAPAWAPATAEPGGAIVRVQMSNDAALRFEERIRELERENRSLTSRVEDLAHQLREAARENERFRNDVEFRLSQIEKGGRAAPPPGKPPGPGPDRGAPPDRGTGDDAAGNSATKDEYDSAIALLRRADYKGAEAALSQFLKRHPAGPQAPNAHFWLGETYLALSRPADAALQYADVVKKYPKHPKAQDSLYKLGVAMARQNKKPEACAAFAEYHRRHPAGALKREVDAEARRLACG